MLQISKKLLICLTSLLLLVTCVSCKTDTPYLIKDYLNYLANKSGIGTSEIIEINFENLLSWQIVEDSDASLLEEPLNYSYLVKTINALLKDDVSNNVINIKNIKDDELIDINTAKETVDKAVNIINNRAFKPNYEYKIKDDQDIYFDEESNTYKIKEDDTIRDAEFAEVFSSFDISDSYTVDFTNAQIIPYQDEYDDTSYVNNKYNLLASKNHVFNSDGFRISYSLNTSGISVHVSKDINDMNFFGDLDIKNVKPSFKWTYKENDLKNCYFNLKMDTTEQFGVSDGRYIKRYFKFKDLDNNSLSSLFSSMLVKEKDSGEAIIPICQIKTPFPNLPNVFLNFDVLLRLSINGKIELVLYNSHNFGFEINEGKARFFYDHDDDFDGIARASGKACLGLNVGVDAATYRLCDVEFDGGLKAELSSTVHVYDADGKISDEKVDAPYNLLEELSKENPNMLVCADASFYWVFDIILNTSKSALYKMGFTKTLNVLDEDNQVFGNLHHIENGMFVDKCTRKSKTKISDNKISLTAYDKITLNTYAEVMIKGTTFNIELLTLPLGYNKNDIRYESSNSEVASVKDGVIYANDYGNAKIKVYTKDNKYNTYVNVLVSTG